MKLTMYDVSLKTFWRKSGNMDILYSTCPIGRIFYSIEINPKVFNLGEVQASSVRDTERSVDPLVNLPASCIKLAV